MSPVNDGRVMPVIRDLAKQKELGTNHVKALKERIDWHERAIDSLMDEISDHQTLIDSLKREIAQTDAEIAYIEDCIMQFNRVRWRKLGYLK